MLFVAPGEAALAFVRTVFPRKIVNAVKFATPGWMGVLEVVFTAFFAAFFVVCLAFEALLAPYTIRIPITRR